MEKTKKQLRPTPRVKKFRDLSEKEAVEMFANLRELEVIHFLRSKGINDPCFDKIINLRLLEQQTQARKEKIKNHSQYLSEIDQSNFELLQIIRKYFNP